MKTIVDQPAPGSAVPALPLAPPIVTIAVDALERARSSVLALFDAAVVASARGATVDFGAVSGALLGLSQVEWLVLAPHATGAARSRLQRWHETQPAFAAAIADLANDTRCDDLAGMLLRRRVWQLADAFRESLAWRRAQFGANASAAAN